MDLRHLPSRLKYKFLARSAQLAVATSLRELCAASKFDAATHFIHSQHTSGAVDRRKRDQFLQFIEARKTLCLNFRKELAKEFNELKAIKALTSFPEDPIMLGLYIRFLNSADRHLDAEPYILKKIKLAEPAPTSDYLLLIWNQFHLNRFKEALSFLFKISDTHVRSRTEFALLHRSGNWEQAIERFSEIKSNAPEADWMVYARLCEKMGKLEEALRAYQHIQIQNEQFFAAYLGEIRIRLDRQEENEALTVCHKGIKNCPTELKLLQWYIWLETDNEKRREFLIKIDDLNTRRALEKRLLVYYLSKLDIPRIKDQFEIYRSFVEDIHDIQTYLRCYHELKENVQAKSLVEKMSDMDNTSIGKEELAVCYSINPDLVDEILTKRSKIIISDWQLRQFFSSLEYADSAVNLLPWAKKLLRNVHSKWKVEVEIFVKRIDSLSRLTTEEKRTPKDLNNAFEAHSLVTDLVDRIKRGLPFSLFGRQDHSIYTHASHVTHLQGNITQSLLSWDLLDYLIINCQKIWVVCTNPGEAMAFSKIYKPKQMELILCNSWVKEELPICGKDELIVSLVDQFQLNIELHPIGHRVLGLQTDYLFPFKQFIKGKLISVFPIQDILKEVFGSSHADSELGPIHYWINLDKDQDRNKWICHQMKYFKSRNKRVPGVHFNELKEIEAEVASDLVKKKEYACSHAHLNAIETGLNEAEGDYFVVMEDDLIRYWNWPSLHALAQTAPEGWEVLQLHVINHEAITELYNLYLSTGKLWTKWIPDYWSAAYYVVRKQAAKKIIDTYLEKGQLHLYRSPTRHVADEIVYNICNSFTLTFPIATTLENSTNLGHSLTRHQIAGNKSIQIWLSELVKMKVDSINATTLS